MQVFQALFCCQIAALRSCTNQPFAAPIVDFRNLVVGRRHFDFIMVFSVKNYLDLAFDLSKFNLVGPSYELHFHSVGHVVHCSCRL